LSFPARHAFGLDLARAAAVCSVLIAHASLFYAEGHPAARYVLIIFGVVGVEIFFALSGFLVGRQLLRVAEGDASAWRFLLRRWYRTLPNYYLFLLVNAALAWWVADRTGLDARFLAFVQSFAANDGRRLFVLVTVTVPHGASRLAVTEGAPCPSHFRHGRSGSPPGSRSLSRRSPWLSPEFQIRLPRRTLRSNTHRQQRRSGAWRAAMGGSPSATSRARGSPLMRRR
jgi:hypothetical protein